MTLRLRPLVGVLVLSTLLGVRSDAGAPITLHFPRFVPDKSTVTVRVDIERNPDNRRLILAWDGPVSGTADRPLDGDNTPSRFLFEHELRELPVGNYIVQGEVLRWTKGEWKEYPSSVMMLWVGTSPAGFDDETGR